MQIESTYQLPQRFRTSIEVLSQVLNMPISIIEHELKRNNYPCQYTSSNCIDEKMLDIFAEKYCRNLKRYFERSIKASDTLSFEESKQFYEFSQTYSKNGRFTKSWRNINKVAIKDDFLRQIVEYTTRKIQDLKNALIAYAESVICSSYEERLRVLDDTDSFLPNTLIYQSLHELEQSLNYPQEGTSLNELTSGLLSSLKDNFYSRVILIEKIKHSRLYLSRHLSLRTNTFNILTFFERIYICARFHIVADDGTGDDVNNTLSLRA